MPRFRKKTFRGSRKARLFGNLLHSFDVFGSARKLYKDFSVLPDNLKKQHRDLMRERLSSFSSSALASSCYALSRWLRWARGPGLNPFPVAPLSFALWLRSISLEFPTSASSAFSALSWLENHLGFDFKSNDPSIAYWKAPNQGHLVTQASPFTLKQWFQLERAALKSTGLCQALLGAWLALLLVVVRYKHFVNSSIHSVDSFLAASTARGKLRRNERRLPLCWSARCDGLSRDVTHVFRVLKSYFLPDCGLPHLDGRYLDDLSVSLPPRPMCMNRSSVGAPHL